VLPHTRHRIVAHLRAIFKGVLSRALLPSIGPSIWVGGDEDKALTDTQRIGQTTVGPRSICVCMRDIRLRIGAPELNRITGVGDISGYVSHIAGEGRGRAQITSPRREVEHLLVSHQSCEPNGNGRALWVGHKLGTSRQHGHIANAEATRSLPKRRLASSILIGLRDKCGSIPLRNLKTAHVGRPRWQAKEAVQGVHGYSDFPGKVGPHDVVIHLVELVCHQRHSVGGNRQTVESDDLRGAGAVAQLIEPRTDAADAAVRDFIRAQQGRILLGAEQCDIGSEVAPIGKVGGIIDVPGDVGRTRDREGEMAVVVVGAVIDEGRAAVLGQRVGAGLKPRPLIVKAVSRRPSEKAVRVTSQHSTFV
jgi:hypothetical protein